MVLTATRGEARLAPFVDHHQAHAGDFLIHPPLERDSDQWSCFNAGAVAWQVEQAADQVAYRSVEPTERRRDPLPSGVDTTRFDPPGMQRRLIWPVSDGYLIALSSVDAGGELWFAPRDGDKPQLLVAKHVLDFINTPHGLLAAVGQSYVTAEYGQILKIAPGPEGWTIHPVVDLGEAPRAVTPGPEGTLLVVTPRSLLRVRPDDGHTELLHEGGWVALSPNSVAMDAGGSIHIGMRQAVVRLVPRDGGYREQWLVPRDCPRLVPGEAGEPCACSDEPAASPALAHMP